MKREINLKNKKNSKVISEPKLRYRMYKSKKRWMYAAISTVSILGGGAISGAMTVAQAETTLANATEATIPSSKVTNKILEGTSNKVANDPDEKRSDFENNLDKNPASSTSVTVKTPDEVVNDAQYKADAISNGTYAKVTTYSELRTAWSNTSITYIDVSQDITYDTGTMAARPTGASVIVQGNNHKIDLVTQTFNWGNINSSTTFTLTNVIAQQGFTQNDGNGYSLINPSGATQLTANVNNVTLTSSETNSRNPIHLMYGVGSKIVFSGTNIFNISNEVTRSVGSINFANDSHVTLNRTSNDIRFSEFYFETRASSSSVGYGNSITMGDGSSNTANTYEGTSANYPAMYYMIDKVLVGDNVNWTQTGFQYFLDGTTGSQTDAKFTFGQNFNLSAPVTVASGAIQTRGTQKAEFNAGTVLDIQQRATGSVIQMAGTSSVQFISPKSLHLAIQNSSGSAAAGRLISGSGTFSMNNSSLNGWTGTNSAPSTPDTTGTFGTLKIANGTTTVEGGTAGSDIIGTTTREIQTNALSVGEIKVNYINQNGEVVGNTTVPVSDDDNFIGQSINLINNKYAIDDMPKGYMWAIDEQVSTEAPIGENGQPDGDPTSEIDNGDEFGQANYAIVPMKDTTYTYNIYVYGEANPNITYTYVDVQTGLAVATNSSSVGIEKARSNNVPANIGNTIDWTKELYTKINVPENYVYIEPNSSTLPSGMDQPTTTQVNDKTTNENVTIYVYSPESSESLSESLSDSNSLSNSVSISESTSNSQSLSDSNSLSDSESVSISESISNSISGSTSDSVSISESISDSESNTISDSDTTSDSISISESLSESLSTSISDSESLSNSISDSDSLSNTISDSESLSNSISDSESLSNSISDSDSLSNSISDSDSLSNTISDSESLSNS
ncbi:pectate lyase-like adhesive domain-containing protein, partial [Lactococcus garvieae]